MKPLGVTILIYLLGMAGSFALNTRMWRLDAGALTALAVYGSMLALPAVAAYWLICVPVLFALRRRFVDARPATLFAIVSCAVFAAFELVLCAVDRGCSRKEMPVFVLLYGAIGAVAGLGYSWCHRDGLWPR